jgi:hypothetical protein
MQRINAAGHASNGDPNSILIHFVSTRLPACRPAVLQAMRRRPRKTVCRLPAQVEQLPDFVLDMLTSRGVGTAHECERNMSNCFSGLD